MAPKLVNATSRRQNIVDGALEVYAEVGFQHASMDDIANHLSISRSQIYYYFDSHDALFTAAFEAYNDRIRASFADFDPTETSVIEILKSILVAGVETGLKDEKLAKVWTDFWVASMRDTNPNDALKIDFSPMYNEYRMLLEGLLQAGVATGEIRADLDIEAAKCGIIALMEGIVFQWMIDPEGVNPTKILPGLVDMLFSGLKA